MKKTVKTQDATLVELGKAIRNDIHNRPYIWGTIILHKDNKEYPIMIYLNEYFFVQLGKPMKVCALPKKNSYAQIYRAEEISLDKTTTLIEMIVEERVAQALVQRGI